MGRTWVRDRCVGVKVFGRGVAIAHPFGFGPRLKVLGGARHDGAHTFVESTMEIDIPSANSVIECKILGVESAFGDDGLFTDKRPVDGIGGCKRDESPLFTTRESFIFFFGLTLGVSVFEG